MPSSIDAFCSENAIKWKPSYETLTGREFSLTKEKTLASPLPPVFRPSFAIQAVRFQSATLPSAAQRTAERP